jgi:hypothetical protein
MGWTISGIAIALKCRMSEQRAVGSSPIGCFTLEDETGLWKPDHQAGSVSAVSSAAPRERPAGCGLLQQVEDVTAIRARRFAELTISGAVPHPHNFH